MKAKNPAYISKLQKHIEVAQKSSLMMWIATTDMDVIFFNDAWLEFRGRNLEDEIGDGWTYGVHPDDLNECLITYHQKFNEHEPFILEYRLCNKSGDFRWVTDSGLPQFDIDGNFIGFIGIVNDIEASKKVSAKIRESQDRYKRIIENLSSHYFFFAHNAEGKFSFMSQSGLDLFGVTSEYTDLSYSDLLTSSEINKDVIGNTILGLKGIKVSPYICEVYDKDNVVRILEITELPVWDSIKNEYFLEGVARDITKDIQIKNVVQNQLNLMDTIIETVPSPLYFKDLNGEITLCNRALLDVLGFKPKDIIGKKVGDFAPKEYAHEYNIYDELAISTGQVQTYQTKLKAKENQILDVISYKAVAKNSKNEPIGIVGIIIDITEQIALSNKLNQLYKKLEQSHLQLQEEATNLSQLNSQLEQSKHHLKQALKDKEAFMSIIAHDLRTPFQGFKSLLDIFSTSANELSPEERESILQTLNESAKNIYALLENLLEWSRIKRGKMPYQPEFISVKAIIELVISLASNNAKQKEIELSSNIDEELFCYADVNMTNTILRNLVFNAIKFTQRTGKIVVEANREAGNMIQVCVIDNGIGMDQKTLEIIFQPHHRFTSSGTEDEPGTGLGIALCSEMAAKQGGKLFANSELGKGTTFSFTLPCNGD